MSRPFPSTAMLLMRAFKDHYSSPFRQLQIGKYSHTATEPFFGGKAELNGRSPCIPWKLTTALLPQSRMGFGVVGHSLRQNIATILSQQGYHTASRDRH
jgi:hypothetical protein